MSVILNKYKSLPLMVKASIWFLICSFLQKGIAVITTPIFTRLFTTEEFGYYNVFISWEGIVSVIVSLNLFYGVYNQGLVKYEKDRNAFSSSMQGLTLFLLMVWYIVYFIFRKFFNSIFSLNTMYVTTMFFLIWFSAIFQFWASDKRVDFSYKPLVIITIIYSLGSPILSICFMSIFEDKVYGRLLGILIGSLVCYLWMFFEQVFKGKKLFSKKYWKHALKFNIPLIPHYLSQTVLNSSDKIMIEKIINASAAALYSLSYSLSLIMTLFNNALSQTISPWMYKKIKNKEYNSIAPVAYSTLIIIAIVNILLIIFAPELVKFFAPKEYYESIWVIPPVAMSVYFMYMYDLFAKFEFYFEKTKIIALATFISAILNIILNYFCISRFGYIAAAYTTLICYIIYTLAHYVFMRQVCINYCENVKPYNSKILLAISITFLVCGFMMMSLYKCFILRIIVIMLLLSIFVIKRNYIVDQIKNIISLKKKES